MKLCNSPLSAAVWSRAVPASRPLPLHLGRHKRSGLGYLDHTSDRWRGVRIVIDSERHNPGRDTRNDAMPLLFIVSSMQWAVLFLLTNLSQHQVEPFVLPVRTFTSPSTAITSTLPPSSLTTRPAAAATTKTKTTIVRHGSSSSSSDDNNSESNDDTVVDWNQEETLLAMNLSPLPDQTLERALRRVRDYAQSFPFAAVLPVQPLQYLPTEDGGVELKFLRKKTEVKSGVDGGIRFFVRPKGRDAVPAAETDGEEEDEDETEGETETEDGPITAAANSGIEVIAKRNSRGQTISKIFAEKLVIQAFVKGMTTGADETEGSASRGGTTAGPSSVAAPKTRFESPTKDVVALDSLFHKWM